MRGGTRTIPSARTSNAHDGIAANGLVVKGAGQKLLAQMDELIMIPHSQRVESLNAGIAASIVLYEAARQRP